MSAPKDIVTDPESFARANAVEHRSYLAELTDERAARILESLLEAGGEPRTARSERPSEPQPPKCWPALLIGRDDHDDALAGNHVGDS